MSSKQFRVMFIIRSLVVLFIFLIVILCSYYLVPNVSQWQTAPNGELLVLGIISNTFPGRIAQRQTWINNFTHRFVIQNTTIELLEENEYYKDMIFCDNQNIERCWFQYAKNAFPHAELYGLGSALRSGVGNLLKKQRIDAARCK